MRIRDPRRRSRVGKHCITGVRPGAARSECFRPCLTLGRVTRPAKSDRTQDDEVGVPGTSRGTMEVVSGTGRSRRRDLGVQRAGTLGTSV